MTLRQCLEMLKAEQFIADTPIDVDTAKVRKIVIQGSTDGADFVISLVAEDIEIPKEAPKGTVH